MQVPIAEMSEGGDFESVPDRDLLDEPDHRGQFASRDCGVLEDRGRLQAGER